MVDMLPQLTVSDPGSATAGTPYGGPYTGPDQFLENGQTQFTFPRRVALRDAIAQLSNGSAPTQAHAYLLGVGNVQNVVAILYSTQIPPNSQYRSVPHLLFNAGATLYVRGVQLSEASTAAAEATNLILMFDPA